MYGSRPTYQHYHICSDSPTISGTKNLYYLTMLTNLEELGGKEKEEFLDTVICFINDGGSNL